MTIDFSPETLPPGAATQGLAFATPDGAATSGLLYTPWGGSKTLVALMHPRVDFSRHYLIPSLLRAGLAVWGQRSRHVNNDLATVHEQLLIDIAVAHRELMQRGFERLILVGNSGGASLYALYAQQAALAAEDRLAAAPSGLAVDLTLPMPQADGVILLAPHPGQGDLLLHCIDPAVRDEAEPAGVDETLDLFSPANGFRPAPESSSFSADFIARYREAQRHRVRRIDAIARDILTEQRQLKMLASEGDREASRRSMAARFITVHRTDADPRTVDLSLDPSDRDYGSIFGRRPDVTNFGSVGFGRLTTAHAWLSTWSGESTNAALRLTLPHMRMPMLLIEYTADNSVFPSEITVIRKSTRTKDLTFHRLSADHYGFLPASGERSAEPAEAITAWIASHT
ncbi:MAG TPA: hypothetical protein VGQ38_10180 [Gaiellaceae bacterium]|nr:hypothetical protein [Gaiellaceae bacterium]